MTRQRLDLDISNLNFLIVEDNMYMRNLLKEILRTFRVAPENISMTPDGAGALKQLETFPADIVLCDWQMSPVSGVEFTKTVRTSNDVLNPYVPIILITGHSELNKVRHARDQGVTEFLAKPVSPASLYDRICSVVLRPRQFVRAPNYAGPDRRRRTAEETETKRRTADSETDPEKLSA
ncbi:MAG: response regulator [Rhodospirillales bacterium]